MENGDQPATKHEVEVAIKTAIEGAARRVDGDSRVEGEVERYEWRCELWKTATSPRQSTKWKWQSRPPLMAPRTSSWKRCVVARPSSSRRSTATRRATTGAYLRWKPTRRYSALGLPRWNRASWKWNGGSTFRPHSREHWPCLQLLPDGFGLTEQI